MKKVHEHSSLGVTPELLVGKGVPSTVVDVSEAWENVDLPIQQNLVSGGQVVFQLNQTSNYIDMSKSYFLIKGRFVKSSDDSTILNSARAAPCELFTEALFSKFDLYFNGTRVNPSRGGYQQIGMLRKLLAKDGSYVAEKTHSLLDRTYSGVFAAGGTAATFTESTPVLNTAYKDYTEAFCELSDPEYAPGDNIPDLIGTNLGSVASASLQTIQNHGSYKRHESAVRRSTDGTFSIKWQPEIGAWHLPSYLLDRVDIRIELTIGQENFYMVGDAMNTGGTNDPHKFLFSKIELVTHQIQVPREVAAQNNAALLEVPQVYPTEMIWYDRYNIASGQTNVSVSGLIQGPKAKAYVVMFQETDRVNPAGGVANKDPYWMNEAGVSGGAFNFVSDIYILVNGKQYPRRSFQKLSRYDMARQYRAYLQLASTGYPDQKGDILDFERFCTVYPMYVFWVDPSESRGESWAPTEQASIDVIATFSAAAANSVTMHVFGIVPSAIEIDAAKTVVVKTASNIEVDFD